MCFPKPYSSFHSPFLSLQFATRKVLRVGAPCRLACDLRDSIREDTGPLDRMLRMLLILDRCDSAAVAGPTVTDASSSMMVSIYRQATPSASTAGQQRGWAGGGTENRRDQGGKAGKDWGGGWGLGGGGKG